MLYLMKRTIKPNGDKKMLNQTEKTQMLNQMKIIANGNGKYETKVIRQAYGTNDCLEIFETKIRFNRKSETMKIGNTAFSADDIITINIKTRVIFIR